MILQYIILTENFNRRYFAVCVLKLIVVLAVRLPLAKPPFLSAYLLTVWSYKQGLFNLCLQYYNILLFGVISRVSLTCIYSITISYCVFLSPIMCPI